jgi:hypothetical protein
MSADRFPRGTRVVIPGGVLGDVVERVGTTDRRIRVNFLDGHAAGFFYEDELKTRSEWLHHARSVMVRIARDIGDGALERAADRLACEILAAADTANKQDRGQ